MVMFLVFLAIAVAAGIAIPAMSQRKVSPAWFAAVLFLSVAAVACYTVAGIGAVALHPHLAIAARLAHLARAFTPAIVLVFLMLRK